MFDLIKSASAATYPWIITNEIYLVQDSRPLYHYPEFKLTPTAHDNWEPQFKPANHVRVEIKTQIMDEPKTVTAVPLLNRIIEEGVDDSSLAESASYDDTTDLNSIHTHITKIDGDKDHVDDGSKGGGSRKGDNDDGGGKGGSNKNGINNNNDLDHDGDRSHHTATSVSKSIGSKSKDNVKNQDTDDVSHHSSSNNTTNKNNDDADP